MSDSLGLPTEMDPLKTSGQTVWIESGCLVVKYSAWNYGFIGQKSIPVRNIATVNWRDTGEVLGGFIEISVLGEAPPSPFASPNVQRQNLFRYPAKDIEKWRNLKNWIEANRLEASASSSSVADELQKLGKLLNDGLLSQAEFDALKSKHMK